mgnify:CR=1 FL=1
MYKIHDLQPPEGSNRRRKRVGRGIGGKGGKTAGRGTKGQKARGTIPAGFEGGQMPLHMRIPKLKGFNNPFRVEYQGINLDVLEESGLSEVTPQALHEKGLVHKHGLVKVLGRGTVSKAITVKAHAFSKSAVMARTSSSWNWIGYALVARSVAPWTARHASPISASTVPASSPPLATPCPCCGGRLRRGRLRPHLDRWRCQPRVPRGQGAPRHHRPGRGRSLTWLLRAASR